MKCRICELHYCPDVEEDIAKHKAIHEKLARGAQPLIIRDIAKQLGWDIAHRNPTLSIDDYRPEVGKLLVIYSYWSRAIQYGIDKKEFDAFMNAHLALVDARVSYKGLEEASKGVKRWECFTG
jgi:hypothetical protein